jgi:hypothetical protein
MAEELKGTRVAFLGADDSTMVQCVADASPAPSRV